MAYLTKDNLYTVWKRTKADIDKMTLAFPEYQRIARNQPQDDDPAYPNVTDGTSASIIQKTPKRTVQQLPIGTFDLYEPDSDNQWGWFPIVAQDIYESRIVPNATEDYGLFEKSHLAIEAGLTFGYSLLYSPFLNHNGEFTADLTLPYWGDVYPQSSKKSIKSAKYIFIRSWWTEEDIDALIESESNLATEAKKRGETYESTWDIKALEKIKTGKINKDKQATTPDQEKSSANTDGIEIVTGFQVGLKANFYTFSPSDKVICRTKVNKDPRGKMPLDVFYGDIDGSNLLGRSIIELIGPLQNLIDSDMQAYQYNRALALRPPMVKHGQIGNVEFAPNVVIDASSDPNAQLIPLNIDTSAIINYPQLYGLQKSQILNLVPSSDTSISAEVGNPGFGKTPTALNQQKAALSVDDGAIRKSWEEAFGNWSETATNLYFAERTGIETLTLQDKTVLKLKKLVETGKLPADFLKGNQVIIDYDDESLPALKFETSPSTSKMADDQTKLQSFQLIQQFIDSSPSIQQLLAQFPDKLIAIYNAFVGLSGVEDPEKLTINEEEQKKVTDPQQSQQMSDEDQQVAQALHARGYDDQIIQQALSMLNQGASETQVMQALGIH